MGLLGKCAYGYSGTMLVLSLLIDVFYLNFYVNFYGIKMMQKFCNYYEWKMKYI
jgi:hypothetical protein